MRRFLHHRRWRHLPHDRAAGIVASIVVLSMLALVWERLPLH